MKSHARLILAVALIGLAGCAAGPTTRPALPPGPVAQVVSDTSRAGITGHERIPLDDIEPHVALPPGKGSSVGLAPLEAVHLYAQAQIALLERDRSGAIDSLQKAVELDPVSYELHVTLGRLYLKPGTEFNDRSIAALEKAAELEPDHIELQTDLGRQYLAKGNTASALGHFRLALRTRQYSSGGPGAVVAEFFLATLLRNEGYDLASLEVYQRLSRHLKSTSVSMRQNVEILPLREHADAIDGEIADLLVRTGRYDDAIAAYAEQVALNPGNFDLRTRQVRLLIVAHHRDLALKAAEDAAVHFRADVDSIALLNEACLAAGHNDGAAGALSRLHEARPTDHAILYALADVLRGDKRDADAQKVLDAAALHDPADFEILRRRVDLLITGGHREQAARILIHATATTPDLVLETGPLWSVLARPTSHGRLRWTDLKALEVPQADEGSKWFWLSRLAAAAHRDDVATDALNRALEPKSHPVFFPAFFDQTEQIWNRQDLDDSAKEAQTRELWPRADVAAGESVADELRAIALMRQNKTSEAVSSFAHAMDDLERKGAPELALARADALRKSGDESSADSLLWKLISDHPTLREAYEDLYLASIRRNLESQAEHVVTTWLAADPQSVTARRIQAIQYQRAGRNEAAEAILLRLFKDHADDPEAVTALSGYYLRRNLVGKLIPLLEQRHAQEPGNLTVSTALADVLAGEHRMDEAGRVVDAARGAVLDDPDLLYSISSLYARVGKKEASEDVLAEVLKLDPAHPGAANDLGYVWADEGRNLSDAEVLIRKAVDAEPGNTSYLDSMGWILYKRGKWADARGFLDRAIGHREAAGSARPADPVVLNHRGDVLWRLGEKDAAASDWQLAADHIDGMKEDADDEMKELRTQLLEKARQAKAGETVKVAPSEGKSQIRSTKSETNSKDESGTQQN